MIVMKLLSWKRIKVGKKIEGLNFVQEGALEMDVCKAKAYDSHVSLKTETDIYILISHFYLPFWFYLWSIWPLNI